MAQLKALKKPETLRTQVENHLRKAIMDGTLRLGEKLVERDLCERLGIGRASLREALRTLEAEKLIVNIPHRGPMVRAVSLEEAKEIYAFRELLESYAAAECAKRASDTEIEQLAQIVERLKKTTKKNVTDEFVSIRSEFFETIRRVCRNSLVEETLNGLLARVRVFTPPTFPFLDRIHESVGEIEAILKCIENRDANSARKKTKAHVQNTAKVGIKFLEAEEHRADQNNEPAE